MFRKLTAILFLLIFALPQFNKLLVVADYYTNTAKYARNCVNKYRPSLHCNGQCQLMKKIREQEKKEQQHQDIRQDMKQEVLSSKSFSPALPCIAEKTIAIQNAGYLFPLTAGHNVEIFHPPGLFS